MTTENTVHLPLIAKELNDAGFATLVTDNAVKVSLNRPIFKSEVEVVLEKVFEGIEFTLTRFGGCVYVQA